MYIRIYTFLRTLCTWHLGFPATFCKGFIWLFLLIGSSAGFLMQSAVAEDTYREAIATGLDATEQEALEKKEAESMIPLPPDETIRRAVSQVFDTLLQEDIAPQDSERIEKLIKEMILPVFDFGRITRRIMAKHYRQASKEQFFNFAVVLRQTLVDTYVRSFLATDYQSLLARTTFEISSAEYHSRNQYRATVPMTLILNGETAINISYTMYFNPARKRWLVENLTVEGINLGITYRNQFDELMSQNRNSIDRTIQAWQGSAAAETTELLDQEENTTSATIPADAAPSSPRIRRIP